jgi:hypothetical protein
MRRGEEEEKKRRREEGNAKVQRCKGAKTQREEKRNGERVMEMFFWGGRSVG